LFYLLGLAQLVLQGMLLLALVCSILWDQLQEQGQAQRSRVWLAVVLFLLPRILAQQMGAEWAAALPQSASYSQ
jgi:hypothetical protein